MKVAHVLAAAALAFTGVAAGTIAAAPAAHAIDFNCSDARLAAEKTICAHTTLANLDERTAQLYGWAWEAADTRTRYQLRDEQRAFLAGRNACASDRRCIDTAYRSRMEELRLRLQSAGVGRRYF